MKLLVWLGVALLAGCVSETEVRRAIDHDPKIVFDAIEKNPDQFMESVDRAARVAQMHRREKQAEEMRLAEAADRKNPKKPKMDNERRLVGPATAPITIVEYADFQCPACHMAHESIQRFLKQHPGDVQFVFKNMPLDFHRMAMPAATYFEAMRLQDRTKAARFHDLLFDGQRELSEDFLKRKAKDVGADMARLAKDIGSDKVKGVISEDMKEFTQFGFNGTPVIIVNGVALQGAQPVEEIERVAQSAGRGN